MWPWASGAPKIWGFFFNTSATAEVSDYKFGTRLGFSKTHYKITPRCLKFKDKLTYSDGRWPWAKGVPKNFGFPYNISATAGASDYKFGAQQGLAKTHHIIARRRNVGRGPGLRKLSKILRFHFNVNSMAETRDFKFITQL